MSLDPEQTKALQEKWRRTQAILTWFVTQAPLYRVVKVPHVWGPKTDAGSILPKTVEMFCEQCEVETTTTWDRTSGHYLTVGSLGDVEYTCRNCKNEVTTFLWFRYVGKETEFEKLGRYPQFKIRPPKELSKALGKRRDLYIKGKTLRHHNYGLGALVYFRRLVEETTDELLDLLEGTVKEAGSNQEEALETIKQAREAQPFEDKVKVAASALPQHLRPGGINPLALLYDLVSYDIHQGTDEEAIKIVDEMDKTLEFLFTELKAHAQDRKAFTEAIKRLAAQRKERQSKKKSV